MKVLYSLTITLFFFFLVVSTSFAITTTAELDGYNVTYGYSFSITQNTVNLFNAELINTSPGNQESDPLIWKFAFNMDATINLDFYIQNIDPNAWSIDSSSGAIQFDYVGDTTGNPSARLEPNASLTFDFVFSETFALPDDPYDIWTKTDESLGTGFGGGDEFGQVAVFFQQLGADGESDTLFSNWPTNGGGGGGGTPVPEPSTVLLLGIGLLGCGIYLRRKAHEN